MSFHQLGSASSLLRARDFLDQPIGNVVFKRIDILRLFRVRFWIVVSDAEHALRILSSEPHWGIAATIAARSGRLAHAHMLHAEVSWVLVTLSNMLRHIPIYDNLLVGLQFNRVGYPAWIYLLCNHIGTSELECILCFRKASECRLQF